MRFNPKLKTSIYQLSAILIVISAIIYSVDTTIAKYTMIIGVIGYTVTTFATPYPGKSIRGKRLHNIQIFAAIFMVVSAYLMYIDYKGWVVILFIAALQTLYCAIALPKAYKQEKEEE